MANEHGYKQMSLADRAEYEAAIKEYFAMERRTDPQWYAFASSRDDPSGERDLRGPNGVSGLLPRAYEWLTMAARLPPPWVLWAPRADGSAGWLVAAQGCRAVRDYLTIISAQPPRGPSGTWVRDWVARGSMVPMGPALPV